MPLRVKITASSPRPEATRVFASDSRLIFSVYRRLRRAAQIPASHITVLLTDNFVDDVRKLSKPIGHSEGIAFNEERVGGLVAAKNLPQADDYSEVVIVFNPKFWTDGDVQDGRWRFEKFFLIAHELAHPLLDRAHHHVGSLDGVTFPSITGGEAARSISRISADEYRADRLADLICCRVFSMKTDAGAHPVSTWGITGENYTSALLQALTQAYPGWPDAVQAYREGRTKLETMWGNIADSTGQTLTFLMHTQAAADSAQAGSVLESEPFAALPAVQLYLAEPCQRFIETIRTQPLLPFVRDLRNCDEDIVRVGEAVLRDIWQRLGLTIEERANREWALWVDEPRR